jgi:uncharacterized protein with HEPN domain
MQPDAGDAARLFDIRRACERTIRYTTTKTLDQFLHDDLLQSAVERQIEIIGEAARGISQDFRDKHPEIPWRPIMSQRHILAHEYGGIDPSLIWRVATVHIP